MIRSTASKVMWVGRATVFLVGLAVILALVLGAATTALSATGGNFILGQPNSADAPTTLTWTGNTDISKSALVLKNINGGFPLQLQAGDGIAPMKVNSATKVAKLNADKLDGKDASAIGVNGLERVQDTSAHDSNSNKTAIALCPTGKVVVGTGFNIAGGKTGDNPQFLTDVVMDEVSPSSTSVLVDAYEEEPTSANWSVTAYAICAKAGTP